MVFPHLGWLEFTVILVIILMLFGVGKLPQVAGSIGKGLGAFRKGQQGEEVEAVKQEPAKPKRKTAKKTAKATASHKKKTTTTTDSADA